MANEIEVEVIKTITYTQYFTVKPKKGKFTEDEAVEKAEEIAKDAEEGWEENDVEYESSITKGEENLKEEE